MPETVKPCHAGCQAWRRIAANMSSRTRRGLGEFQPLQFNPLGADVGKVVLRPLHKPAFGAASEDLGQPDGHFRRYAALAVHQFRKRGAA